MDTLEQYRGIIEKILSAYTEIPYAYGDIQTEAVFDRTRDRYLLVNVGWDNHARVHGTLAHLEIRNGKIWIQRDGIETGLAKELVQAGIPKDRIVLGFRSEMLRRHTGYAIA